LPEQRTIADKGGTMRLGLYPIVLGEGSLASRLYGQGIIQERHRHRYEVNNDYVHRLEKHGLRISGIWAEKQLVEILEIPEHPYRRQATHGGRRPRGPRYNGATPHLRQATLGRRRARGPRYNNPDRQGRPGRRPTAGAHRRTVRDRKREARARDGRADRDDRGRPTRALHLQLVLRPGQPLV